VTPSGGPTPPPGFPPLPTIPALPTLSSPQILTPDGADDTAMFNNAFALGDLDVQPGVYSISGMVVIPTGRNMKCEPGAVLFDPNPGSAGTYMFSIGDPRFQSPPSLGNNAVWGCDFEGTDTAADYSTYNGGLSGYYSMFRINNNQSNMVQNVLFENNVMNNSQGDFFITYSNCGTATANSWQCGNGAINPANSGPQYIYAVNNSFSHCAAGPGIHFNGGQHLVATGNTFIDCDADDEADNGVLQVITSYWWFNTMQYRVGTWHPADSPPRAAHATMGCTGDFLIPEDDSGCYSWHNTIDNQTLQEPDPVSYPSCLGYGGHYADEMLMNGGWIQTDC
jgi:hypothetical protein